ARDNFWQLLIDLSRNDHVTIFISTHFMNEAERCDRISLMHAGKVLVSDQPAELVRRRGCATLEEAFIAYLVDASGAVATPAAEATSESPAAIPNTAPANSRKRRFDWRRAYSYAQREALELKRDPVRGVLALLGTAILMFIMGYGITMDVENLTFAVLDNDQTTLSQSYALNLAGSRYFIERPPITDYDNLDARMRSGDISLAIEIPPNFGRDIKRGKTVQVGAWVDGAMPARGETIRGYVQGMHQQWLQEMARSRLGVSTQSPATIE